MAPEVIDRHYMKNDDDDDDLEEKEDLPWSCSRCLCVLDHSMGDVYKRISIRRAEKQQVHSDEKGNERISSRHLDIHSCFEMFDRSMLES